MKKLSISSKTVLKLLQGAFELRPYSVLPKSKLQNVIEAIMVQNNKIKLKLTFSWNNFS